MHVMEDVREGSDVPGAQPSSPGHADEGGQPSGANSPSVSLKNGDIDSPPDSNGTEAVKEEVVADDTEKLKQEKSDFEFTEKTNGEAQPSKRKSSDVDDAPVKKIRSEIQQSFVIRDKILEDYLDAAGCSTVEQMQIFMEQTVSEIKMLNELAREKEREWNNIIHLKKLKEELVLRIQRQKQVMVLNNEKIDFSNHELVGESQAKLLEERLRSGSETNNHGYKNNSLNSGIMSLQNVGLRISNTGRLERLQNKERLNVSRAFSNAGKCIFQIIIDSKSSSPKTAYYRIYTILTQHTSLCSETSQDRDGKTFELGVSHRMIHIFLIFSTIVNII